MLCLCPSLLMQLTRKESLWTLRASQLRTTISSGARNSMESARFCSQDNRLALSTCYLRSLKKKSRRALEVVLNTSQRVAKMSKRRWRTRCLKRHQSLREEARAHLGEAAAAKAVALTRASTQVNTRRNSEK